MFLGSIQALSGRSYCAREFPGFYLYNNGNQGTSLWKHLLSDIPPIEKYGWFWQFLTTSPFKNELLSKALTLYITALLVKLNNQKTENAIRWSQYFWLLDARIFSMHGVLRKCSWYCNFNESNENTWEAHQC